MKGRERYRCNMRWWKEGWTVNPRAGGVNNEMMLGGRERKSVFQDTMITWCWGSWKGGRGIGISQACATTWVPLTDGGRGKGRGKGPSFFLFPFSIFLYHRPFLASGRSTLSNAFFFFSLSLFYIHYNTTSTYHNAQHI